MSSKTTLKCCIDSIFKPLTVIFYLGPVFSFANAAENQQIVYDHSAKKSQPENYEISVEPRNYIDLTINNTCKNTTIAAIGFTPGKNDNGIVLLDNKLDRAAATPLPMSAMSCKNIVATVNKLIEEKRSTICFKQDSKNEQINYDTKYSGYLVKLKIPSKNKSVKVVTEANWTDVKEKTLGAALSSCTNTLKNISEKSKLPFVSGTVLNDPEILNEIDKERKSIINTAEKRLEKLEGVPVSNVDLFIGTAKSSWITEFSGGVLVSSLTDRVYSAALTDNSISIIRNSSAEDEQSLKLGAFTHVSHSSWKNSIGGVGTPAITAGLSVNNGDSLDYLVGPSIKFGSAILNFGYHWGQVSRLPNSIIDGQAITTSLAETNAILTANSETRTDRGWFISLSFTFDRPATSPFKPLLAIPATKVETDKTEPK